MPRGIPKAKAAELAIQKTTVIPPRAKHFPLSDKPIPEGVTIRSSKGVQIEFMFQGVRCTETLRGKPTVAHVLAAADKRERVLQLIGLGHFNYEQEFPDSARAQSIANNEEARKIPTLGEALDRWLASVQNTVGPNAFKDYVKDSAHLQLVPLYALESPDIPINKRRVGLLSELPVTDLTDTGINYLRSWWLAKPISIKRILNLLIPLRGAMRHVTNAKLLTHNPFDYVRPLVKSKAGTITRRVDKFTAFKEPLPMAHAVQFENEDGMPDPFSEQEVQAILGQLSGPFFNQILFWLWTGLRTGELIGLQWCDVDTKNKRIYIRRSISRGIETLPKNRRMRWVTLSEMALAALEAQRNHTEQKGQWVFLNPWTGERWANESKIRSRFKKACELAGVRYRRPYHCRHTYASTLLSSGENHLYVAEQMGHKDWSMISQVYGRWMNQAGVQAGQRLAESHSANWEKLRLLLAERQSISEDLASEVEGDDEETGLVTFDSIVED
jgi:integrase